MNLGVLNSTNGWVDKAWTMTTTFHQMVDKRQ
jgi:hypothetical protein